MQDIMNRAKELYEKILVRGKKYDEQFAALKGKMDKAIADEQSNDSFRTELNKREKKIKSIEDIVKLRDEVASGYRELISGKKLLKKEKDEFEVYKANSEDEVKVSLKEVVAKREKITKMQLDLDKEKKKYKEQVMANVNKTLKDKGLEL